MSIMMLLVLLLTALTFNSIAQAEIKFIYPNGEQVYMDEKKSALDSLRPTTVWAIITPFLSGENIYEAHQVKVDLVRKELIGIPGVDEKLFRAELFNGKIISSGYQRGGIEKRENYILVHEGQTVQEALKAASSKATHVIPGIGNFITYSQITGQYSGKVTDINNRDGFLQIVVNGRMRTGGNEELLQPVKKSNIKEILFLDSDNTTRSISETYYVEVVRTEFTNGMLELMDGTLIDPDKNEAIRVRKGQSLKSTVMANRVIPQKMHLNCRALF